MQARSPRLLFLLLIATAAVGLACAARVGPYGESGQACVPVADRARLLVAHWPDRDLQPVESGLLSGNILVARATCQGLALLPMCSLEGDYRYGGLRPKEQTVAFVSAKEATINLGRQQVSDEVPSPLRVIRVGKAATTRIAAKLSELRGDCAGATHFVKAISIGALAADAPGAEACRALSPGTEVPPDGCRSLLRLELAALAPPTSTRGEGGLSSFCPRGWRWTGSHCIEGQGARLFECDDDLEECESQCALGSLPSCARQAYLLTHGDIPESREIRRAFRLYGRACDHDYAPACFELGLLTSKSAPDHDEATAYFRRACDEGIPAACSRLGLIEAEMRGAGDVLPAFFDHLLRGCAGGDATGCYRAARVSRRGGLPQDYALSLFERACLGNLPDACLEAAGHLERTAGSRARVASLLERACQAGSADACQRINAKM